MLQNLVHLLASTDHPHMLHLVAIRRFWGVLYPKCLYELCRHQLEMASFVAFHLIVNNFNNSIDVPSLHLEVKKKRSVNSTSQLAFLSFHRMTASPLWYTLQAVNIIGWWSNPPSRSSIALPLMQDISGFAKARSAIEVKCHLLSSSSFFLLLLLYFFFYRFGVKEDTKLCFLSFWQP